MQIYDKLADSVQLFNKIYSGQVFMMFFAWLLCTLLIFCRIVSPFIKNTNGFVYSFHSDIYVYACFNYRPLFLAILCQMFIIERNKTLSLLLQVLLVPGKDGAYFNQVETMIMLVKARKLEIYATEFTINIPTVMKYGGQIISFTLVMIQFFYKNVLFEKAHTN
ncbi:uncharacterized protein LOC142976807 [Anticarsia gemmatalis]|uniref:uncharacterized protein LOC142976807 n=1 Tax=Anticarsia gemmatalis TaxID=129554 RepID=UPI003F75E4E4